MKTQKQPITCGIRFKNQVNQPISFTFTKNYNIFLKHVNNNLEILYKNRIFEYKASNREQTAHFYHSHFQDIYFYLEKNLFPSQIIPIGQKEFLPLLEFMYNKFFNHISFEEKKELLYRYFEFDASEIIIKYKILNLFNFIINDGYDITTVLQNVFISILKTRGDFNLKRQWRKFYSISNFYKFFNISKDEVIKYSQIVKQEIYPLFPIITRG
jgi:hypothetical protein